MLFLLARTPLVTASGGVDEDNAMMPATRTAHYAVQHESASTFAAASPRVTAQFNSFGGEALSIDFSLDADAGRKSVREFGISRAEIDALAQRCKSDAQCAQAQLSDQIDRYYSEHALRMRFDEKRSMHLYVDVPKVVQRNRTRVQPVAAALRQLARERGQDTQWTLEAAVALVQTGLRYQQPSSQEDGRKILGFYPPPRALEQGYGDCDTKSALLAAILQNLTDAPIIGVHIPGHYLLGVAMEPAPGQTFMHYQGRQYVLVEAAGPAMRRPGEVARATEVALHKREGMRIDPMF
ncbi:hypothetical protein E4T66_08500 [Sinimarinibacterium sp. CAU 1509]|uniref:hypothetical protein n=1 Tax=Sinimarinibacterium sp. CAU 1509 TaxID=2562283 RepID=UPI0010AC42BC|nr:hypothetical protein [Sinimarinibacterium sp. CAU 1509]TJY62251.1 hypothetical protein E4T66_08500 [Sinimarinibacterium sp. CAU 1509]